MYETQGASPKAVQFHYDLSNDFYAQWLDSSMTYTCALFEDRETIGDLFTAQLRKIDFFASHLAIGNGTRILDVGCGWGGMLKRMVEHHGADNGVGLSLSKAQAEWFMASPVPAVEMRVESWEDHHPTHSYDAIVSIEAIEAFVKPGLRSEQRVDIYRHFFQRCHSWLKPGGRLGLQAIAYGNSGPEDLDAFISNQIFPENDLPRLCELAIAAERLFEIKLIVNHRDHYVRTLRAWLDQLRAHREKANNIVGVESVLRYEEYLRLSIYIFSSGSCDLLRIIMKRIDFPRNRGN